MKWNLFIFIEFVPILIILKTHNPNIYMWNKKNIKMHFTIHPFRPIHHDYCSIHIQYASIYIFILFVNCVIVSIILAGHFIDTSNYYRWYDDVSVKMWPFVIYSIIMWPNIRKSHASFTMAKNGHSVKWTNFQIESPICSNSMDTRKVMLSVCSWTIGPNSWPLGWAYRKSVSLFH